jgi:hypothetical protein
MYPADDADMIAPSTMVPQFAPAVPKSSKFKLLLTPAEVADHDVVSFVIDRRAYEVPPDVETSVPPPADVGAAVNSAMYTVARRV